MPSSASRASKADIDRFYVALTTLLRNFQFRDRDRQTICGITVTQCYALDCIVREERLTISDVGQQLMLNKSNASRVVNSLEARRLTKRMGDPANHRIRWVTATAAGRRLHNDIMRELKADYGRILANYDSALIHTVSTLLETIAQRATQGSKMRCQ